MLIHIMPTPRTVRGTGLANVSFAAVAEIVLGAGVRRTMFTAALLPRFAVELSRLLQGFSTHLVLLRTSVLNFRQSASCPGVCEPRRRTRKASSYRCPR